jgi:hypothetical protein
MGRVQRNRQRLRPAVSRDGAKYQVAPGHSPVWSRDGKRLFYAAAGGDLAVIPIMATSTISFAGPTAIPSANRLRILTGLNTPRRYDVAPDDTIFGVMESSDAAKITAAPQITVVLNWFEELKERAPISAR